jgi:hypothetical protein
VIPKGPYVLPTVAAGVAAAAVLADCLVRLRARQRAESRLHQALEDYAPAFLLYWEAPVGSSHQIAMWLPYLERLERRFIVVLRTPDTFAETVQLTEAPVIVRRYVSELDALITSSLKVAFFVNTAPKNAHMVHYLGVTQIQLNHGDSDKAPSYRRVFRMYDRNFVAGQAAIDRFGSHGVEVPREAFEIVGRHRSSRIEVATGRQREHREASALRPDLVRLPGDSRYSSLPIGAAIVGTDRPRLHGDLPPAPVDCPDPGAGGSGGGDRALLDAEVQRTGRSTDSACRDRRQHLRHVQRRERWSSDVQCDPDFLYSEKPFIVTLMVPVSNGGVHQEFPRAGGLRWRRPE